MHSHWREIFFHCMFDSKYMQFREIFSLHYSIIINITFWNIKKLIIYALRTVNCKWWWYHFLYNNSLKRSNFIGCKSSVIRHRTQMTSRKVFIRFNFRNGWIFCKIYHIYGNFSLKIVGIICTDNVWPDGYNFLLVVNIFSQQFFLQITRT